MPPRGARPPDPYVLSRLGPAHRELVELLYRLYDEQQKLLPRPLEKIGIELGVSKSMVSEFLHGTRIPPDARRLAEVLGGSYTDLDRAADLARRIKPRKVIFWSLGGDDAADHLTLRATGRRPGDGRGGDLFTGRAPAIDRIRQWLQARDCPGTVLVVTGQPGAGKSSVIARTVRELETAGMGDGLFFHARGGTRDNLLQLVRRQTRDQSITGTQGWMAHLQRRSTGSQEPLLIVVDALDEAVSGPEITRISQLLTSIAAHPAARVVVATRRGHRDQLLHGLGARSAAAANLVDLDSDTYFEPKDLERVAARHLTQDDVTHPGPPNTAWTQYGGDTKLTGRLAKAIARRAKRNFLVAAFAAHSLSTATEVLDAAAAGFDETLIPSSVAEAFTKYFDTIPDDRQRFRVRRLLTALAYAYGPGLDDDTWLLFARALGLTVTRDDVLQLRRSPVADYLLESHPADPGQPVRTRLYHQALVDQLRADAEPDDGPRILRHLTPTQDSGWSTASSYVRRYLIDHAAVDGDMLDLLRRPVYLSVADLQRVLATISFESTSELRDIAALLRLGITSFGWLTQLQQTLLLLESAEHLGLDAWRREFSQLADALGGPTLLWAHSIPRAAHHTIVRPAGSATAVAIGHLGSRDVIVSGGMDGTVRVMDQRGTLIGLSSTGHGGPVSAVAIGRLGGQDVIVSGNDHRIGIQIWDQHGNPIGQLITDNHDRVTAVAIGRLGNRDVIVSGSRDRTVRIWDQHGDPIGQLFTEHHDHVTAVAIGPLDGRDVIVSTDCGIAGFSGTTHIWDQTDALIGQPFTGHHDAVSAIAIGRLGNRDVIVSGSRDRTVRIWDQHGDPIGQLLTLDQELTDQGRRVTSVAVGNLGGRDVIVSGSVRRTGVRVWDQHGTPISQPITDQQGHVTAVAIGRLGGRDVIVSGSMITGPHWAVQIWNQDGAPISQPLTGHIDIVSAVAIGRLGRRDVIVSGSHDRTVRIWDQHGNLIGHPLADHRRRVTSVAIGALGDRDVIVSGGDDHTVRIWDQYGKPIGQPLTDHDGRVTAVAIGRLGDQDVIVSGGDDHTVRIWDQGGQRGTVLPVVAAVVDVALNGSVVYAAVGRALVAWKFK